MAEEPAYRYDGFISYRRKDALPLARWLRDRLIKFRIPQKLVEKRTPTPSASINIFLDKSYEKASEDFLNEKILPALRASKALFILVTPEALGQAAKGSWMQREIEEFVQLKAEDSKRKIFVVYGPGVREGAVPDAIKSLSRDADTGEPMWDYADASKFSRWWMFKPLMWELLDECALKLAASVYAIPDDWLPQISKADAWKRTRWLTSAISFLVLIIAALSTLTIWAFWEQKRADEQTQIALSQQMAATSQLATQDNPSVGMRMALKAWGIRPTSEAESSLRYALMQRVPTARLQMGSAQWFDTKERLLVTYNAGRLTLYQLEPKIKKLLDVEHPSVSDDARVWITADGRVMALSDPNHSLTIWDHNADKTPLLKNGALEVKDGEQYEGNQGEWSYFVDHDRYLRLSNAQTLTVFLLKVASRVKIPCFKPNFNGKASEFQRAANMCKAVSNNGTMSIHTNEDGSSVIYENDKTHSVLGEHKNRVWSAAFSGDDKWVATASSDGTARIWDVATARTVAILRELEAETSWVAFSPQGRWVLTSKEIWRTDWRGRLLQKRCVDSLSFDLSSRYLIGTTHRKSTTTIWDLDDSHNVDAVTFEANVAADMPSSYSWDGREIIGFNGKTVKTFQFEEKRSKILFQAEKIPKQVAFFGPKDQQILTVNTDGTLSIWDKVAKSVVQQIKDEFAIDDVAVSQDGDMLLAGGDKETVVYQYSAGKLQQHSRLMGTIVGFSDLVLDRDAKQVLTYANTEKTIYLWDLRDGKQIAETPVQSKPRKMGFRNANPFIMQWDESRFIMATGVGSNRLPPVVIPVRDWEIKDAELSQNGRVLIMPSKSKAGTKAGIHTVTVRDAVSGIALTDLYGQTNLVDDAAFSPDNKRIATAYSCGVLVFECPACLSGSELISIAQNLDNRVP